MIIKSKSFDNDGNIPLIHTGFGKDISPELAIIHAPDNSVSLAVILDDFDVPFRKRFNHWIIWNIPKTDVIPEGIPEGATIERPLKACQGIAWGKHRYRGPKQPFFIKKEHRYVFTVYALDALLDISVDSKKKDLLDAMSGHILAKAQLTGRFKPQKEK